MANDMTYDQIAATLNEINKQVTGEETIAPVNTSEFITVAQTLLKTGYDPVMHAISQVMHRTIYSARNFDPKVDFLRVSNERYGNHVRKVNYLDSELTEDVRYNLTDGQSVDQYVVNSPKVVQTNFYGVETYEKSLTIFGDQLDAAFSNPDELGSFWSGALTNVNNQLNMTKDTTARMIMANFIAGKISADSGNVLHLVTMYNGEAGTELDSETVLQDGNFEPFAKWLYATIQTVCDLMTERTIKYHINLADKNIPRHTPYPRQRLTLLGGVMNKITSIVLSSVFNDDKLKMASYNKVNFWQSIDSPSEIKVSAANVLNSTTGAISQTSAVNNAHIIGMITDEEAMGYTIVNQKTTVTPYNARGDFFNQYWKGAYRYWNDFTENGIILCLD